MSRLTLDSSRLIIVMSRNLVASACMSQLTCKSSWLIRISSRLQQKWVNASETQVDSNKNESTLKHASHRIYEIQLNYQSDLYVIKSFYVLDDFNFD